MPTTSEFSYSRSLSLILALEGGWWPGTAKSDPNPTMAGVTQRTYDQYRQRKLMVRQTVHNITPGEVREIYRGYWDAAGCPHLDWPVSLVQFDTAVNSGPGNAVKLGKRAGYNWQRYLEVRQAFYDAVIARHPEKAPNGPGWRKRLLRLRTYIERNP